MCRKSVNILTNKGTVNVTFECGLEQVNPDSPKAANLVIKMKHDAWMLMNKLQTNLQHKLNDGYKFQFYDTKDKNVILCRMSYGNDNSICNTQICALAKYLA